MLTLWKFRKRNLVYRIVTNYRTGSVGTDVEDKLLQEYEMMSGEININIKEYVIEETKMQRWEVKFLYKDIQYSLWITGISENELNKIIGNLKFI